MSNHPTRQDWDSNRIVLTEESDDWTAYCSPEAEGHIFVDEEQVSSESGNKIPLDQHGAPFTFDIVFHERYPAVGEIEAIAENLGTAFSEQFDGKVDTVYQMLEEADDPLDAIMDLEPDGLIVEPEDE